MKRGLSAAVKVRDGIPDEAFLDPSFQFRLQLPTDPEVRDALARVTRELEDMRLARHPDFTVIDGSFSFRMIELENHELVLRGTLAIERAD